MCSARDDSGRAMQQDGRAYRDLVLAAVWQDGMALRYASEELQADREIVLAAVQQDGRALCFASEELQADHEIVLAAVRQDGRAPDYASAELQADQGGAARDMDVDATRDGGQDCGGQDNDVVRTRAPPASGVGTSCSDQSGEVGHPSDLTPWFPSLFPRHTPKPGQPPYVFHSSDPPLVCHADELRVRVRLHEMAVGTVRKQSVSVLSLIAVQLAALLSLIVCAFVEGLHYITDR